ncbi:RIP metalloprotease RseP [Pseudoduganella sp. GCM10020061]|uniref:RIP metalloprotease RseP n=1 Tax=Pseudoduganella sp. GCM10020061 TaxID=3317345 RepID=UPI003632E88F
MTFLTTVLAFLLALGPLIVFHELGHYAVARLCGVKVLRFSIGMGKVVWSRRFGRDQTEWAVSALPLGGYVKMLDARELPPGSVSEAERGREFTGKTVWQRIAIVAAGPLANFLLAIVVISGLYMYGVEEPSTRIRTVPAQSAAAAAGLQGGDVVTAVNGEPVQAWSELRMALLDAVLEKEAVRLELRRGGAAATAELPAAAVARIDVESDIAAGLGLAVWRPKAAIGEVPQGSVAAGAGLRSGDVVLAVDGRPVVDGIEFIDIVRASAGRPLTLDIERAGQRLSLALTPQADPKTGKGRIGAELSLAPEMVSAPSGPFAALAKACASTWDTITRTLSMIGKMVTGEVSWRNVTGPITIADYAGQTARMGPEVFLNFIAFISISLGVMNLLPIPVLDGGLLLYYSLEVLTGRPLSERVGAFAQRLGVGLLFTLMALAFFNDIMRYL